MLGDRQTDVEADEVGEPQRTDREAIPELHPSVYVLSRGHALLDHPDGLEPDGDTQTAGRETGRILDLDALLLDPLHPPAGGHDGVARRPFAYDDLYQCGAGNRIEEVHADEPLGMSEGAGHVV